MAQINKQTSLALIRTFGACCLVIVCVFGLYLAQPALLKQLERGIYDLLLHTRAGGEPSPVPVLVDIDEKSISELGQWPWPRYQMARLIEELTLDGAAAIGLDILLAEPDRSSPLRVKEHLERDLGARLDYQIEPKILEDNDLLLAEVIKQCPVVLGAYLYFNPGETVHADPPIRPLGLAWHGSSGAVDPLSFVSKARGMSLPMPMFYKAAPVGSINSIVEDDSIIRTVPVLVNTPDGPVTSLAMRALMVAQRKSALYLRATGFGLDSLVFKPHTLPLTPQGNLAVAWRGPRHTYPYYSAADVLAQRLPPGTFKDKIIFVGSSAPGLLDMRAMPFDSFYPGMEAHAAVVDTILSGRAISFPPWGVFAQAVGIVLSAIFCSAFFGLARPALYVPAGAALVSCVLGAAYWLFQRGIYVSPLYTLLTIVLSAGGILCLRFWMEEHKKRVLQRAFGRYVAPEVVSRILSRGGDVLAGEKREVTILFTDIRGFTTLSEKLAPEQVVEILNRYFTPMTALIRQNQGTLDKFIGDALMAFWNAPLDIPDHPKLAVGTALAVQENLHSLNDELERDFGVRLAMGAGLHTGDVFVGNMGSEDLLDYTIIGDNVNLTSRLEGLTGAYGVPTLVSGAVREICGEAFAFTLIDTVTVKGKSLPVDIYEPMRHEVHAGREAELILFAEARELYCAGDFAAAGAAFGRLAASFPQRKLYAVYQDRALELAAEPPQDWTGIWALTKK